MKNILVMSIIALILGGCATTYRFAPGQAAIQNGCSVTIVQVLDAYNYRITGCGEDRFATSDTLERP